MPTFLQNLSLPMLLGLLGVVCLVAAVVGGGFKLFGAELPVISVRRQLMLVVVSIGLIATSFMWGSKGPTSEHAQEVSQAIPKPQPFVSPYSPQRIGFDGPASIAHPHGVAVDSSGAVYVADHDKNRVLKLPAGSSDPVTLPFSGLNFPSGVAVDGRDTVYVADSNNNRVLRWVKNSPEAVKLPFTGLNGPRGVAVDGSGTVYVADHDNHRVMMLEANSSTPTQLPFTRLDGPAGVAVDGAGSVYVTDEAGIRVYQLYKSTPPQRELFSYTGLSGPHGVAVDHDFNVYVTDASNRVLKLAPGATNPTELAFSGLDSPGGVAVDSSDNVYVADWGHDRVLKLAPGEGGH
jgi:serine/threonine protein kinase, bacterial